MIERRPAVVIRCRGAVDIVEGVGSARHHGSLVTRSSNSNLGNADQTPDVRSVTRCVPGKGGAGACSIPANAHWRMGRRGAVSRERRFHSKHKQRSRAAAGATANHDGVGLLTRPLLLCRQRGHLGRAAPASRIGRAGRALSRRRRTAPQSIAKRQSNPPKGRRRRRCERPLLQRDRDAIVSGGAGSLSPIVRSGSDASIDAGGCSATRAAARYACRPGPDHAASKHSGDTPKRGTVGLCVIGPASDQPTAGRLSSLAISVTHEDLVPEPGLRRGVGTPAAGLGIGQ
jgi:hypothetical protein